ncbi:SspB family protein [Geminicoccus roseus]|uniref:SspB family protein n=1 Tax=Geminicoccus roseus TaxID=404900 RepID=UPI000487F62B|nr:ClpXP protease specificity-enhancing factor SspB [Geminicoccus roseus]
MSKDTIFYGHLVEQALRGVVRDVLSRVAREGMPSPHHFYITFRTDHPGVGLAASLRERYPNEMTIVLQHQYWDLEVDDETVAVTLSFNNQPQRIVIPFAALKVFADPGVEFGLQFTIEPTAAEPAAETVPLLAAREREARAEVGAPGEDAEEPVPEGGAQIVSLDRFRKR